MSQRREIGPPVLYKFSISLIAALLYLEQLFLMISPRQRERTHSSYNSCNAEPRAHFRRSIDKTKVNGHSERISSGYDLPLTL